MNNLAVVFGEWARVHLIQDNGEYMWDGTHHLSLHKVPYRALENIPVDFSSVNGGDIIEVVSDAGRITFTITVKLDTPASTTISFIVSTIEGSLANAPVDDLATITGIPFSTEKADIYPDGRDAYKATGVIVPKLGPGNRIERVIIAHDSDGNNLTITDQSIFEVRNGELIKADGSASDPPAVE